MRVLLFIDRYAHFPHHQRFAFRDRALGLSRSFDDRRVCSDSRATGRERGDKRVSGVSLQRVFSASIAAPRASTCGSKQFIFPGSYLPRSRPTGNSFLSKLQSPHRRNPTSRCHTPSACCFGFAPGGAARRVTKAASKIKHTASNCPRLPPFHPFIYNRLLRAHARAGTLYQLCAIRLCR